MFRFEFVMNRTHSEYGWNKATVLRWRNNNGSPGNGVGMLKDLALRLTGARKNDRANSPWSLPPQVKDLINTVRPYTMVDPLRLAMLHQLAQEISVSGDVVECGVCNGGSAAVLARAISSNSTRSLWLYDTYQGMPAPTTKDGPEADAYTGRVVGSVDRVKEVLALVEFPTERTVFRKGAFKDSFKEPIPQCIALLHIDADWYDGVLGALTTFYHLIPDGGFVILDDFGHWEGAREAFYEFCTRFNTRPVLERLGYTQAFWRKGQTHNRSIAKRYPHGMYGLGVDNF
jgi:O-methyltransferase